MIKRIELPAIEDRSQVVVLDHQQRLRPDQDPQRGQNLIEVLDMGEHVREGNDVRQLMFAGDSSRDLLGEEGLVGQMAFGGGVLDGTGRLDADGDGALLAKEIEKASVVATDIKDLGLRQIAEMILAAPDERLHPGKNIGGEAGSIVIGLREQLALLDLEPLVTGLAAVAKQDLDRIFAAVARIADRHEVVAHRMEPKVEDGVEPLASTDFASVNPVQTAGWVFSGALNHASGHLHQLSRYPPALPSLAR